MKKEKKTDRRVEGRRRGGYELMESRGCVVDRVGEFDAEEEDLKHLSRQWRRRWGVMHHRSEPREQWNACDGWLTRMQSDGIRRFGGGDTSRDTSLWYRCLLNLTGWST
jgi:hypothetical protein